MKLDPRKDLAKRSTKRTVRSLSPERKEAPSHVPRISQDAAEKENLRKLQKSLKELILEKEGGSAKKLKTFAL